MMQTYKTLVLSHDDRKIKQFDDHAVIIRRLTPLAQRTLDLLRDGLDKRFFSRYYDPESPLIYEMQLFLHPVFKSLGGIKKIVADDYKAKDWQAVDAVAKGVEIIQRVEDKITQLAMAAMEAPPEIEDQSLRNGVRNNLYGPSMDEAIALGFGDLAETTPASSLHQSVHQSLAAVSAEIRRYKLEKVDKENTTDLLLFWKGKASSYPMLYKVARVVFGCPPSAGPVELDFCIAGLIVNSRRARLAAHYVEMCHFINRNRAEVDISQIDTLTNDEALNAFPTNVRASEQLFRSAEVCDMPSRDRRVTSQGVIVRDSLLGSDAMIENDMSLENLFSIV
jgi:hypothetical protein